MEKLFVGCIFALLFTLTNNAQASDFQRKAAATASKLQIAYDANTDRVIVSWSGKGVLKQASEANGKFRPVRGQGNQSYYVAPRSEKKVVYRLESGTSDASYVYSQNVVGYVNIHLPPGLSLINNPLVNQSGNGEFTYWGDVADGSQVLKYNSASGYDVSTFDSLSGGWSNPNMELPVGQGFYFRNTGTNTIVKTFVGEVMQGTLVNPLPAGYSMKGSMVPQAGSINTLHKIPGRPGDQIRTYTNDGLGGGDENISTFSAELNRWEPDLNLGVGEGFWVYKQEAQDWVRVFTVN